MYTHAASAVIIAGARIASKGNEAVAEKLVADKLEQMPTTDIGYEVTESDIRDNNLFNQDYRAVVAQLKTLGVKVALSAIYRKDGTQIK